MLLGLLVITGCSEDKEGVVDEKLCELVVEQRVACYKGCQFTTQPIFEITPIKNEEARIMLYDDCTKLCQGHYDVEYDEDGDCIDES